MFCIENNEKIIRRHLEGLSASETKIVIAPLRMTIHTLTLATVLFFGMPSESWASYTKRTYDDYGNIAMVYDCTNANNCTPSIVYDYTYDENGNRTSYKYCSSSNIDSNGNCTAYSQRADYTYDANGNQTSYKNCSSSNIDSNGNCTAYSSVVDYTYDKKGNKIYERTCNSSQMDGFGNCTAYSSGTDYTYDANDRQTSRKDCASYDSTGNCTSYSYSRTETYDGNVKQSWICNNASLIDSSGNCTAYSTIGYATYDANGHIISFKGCNDSSKMDSSGNCTAYTFKQDYTYDANGNQTSFRSCSSFYSNGSCKEYSLETYNTNEYSAEYLACTNRVNGKCETCGNGYYKKAGTCVSSSTGCGEGYTADNDTMQCVKNSSGNPSQDEPVVEDNEEPQVSGQATSAAECKNNGQYWQEGKCVSSCGASFKLNDGWCDRQRYTPAEAAQVLHDDNTNEVTITFRK